MTKKSARRDEGVPAELRTGAPRRARAPPEHVLRFYAEYGSNGPTFRVGCCSGGAHLGTSCPVMPKVTLPPRPGSWISQVVGSVALFPPHQLFHWTLILALPPGRSATTGQSCGG